jgi:hypothetical protein
VHKEFTTDFCPSTLHVILELAIHLVQEQYKTGLDGRAVRDMYGEVRKSGYSAARRRHTHAVPDTLDSCDYSI